MCVFSTRIQKTIERFISVGPKLANKLPSAQRNYFDFLNRSNSPDTSFAFNLVNPKEVKLEISRILENISHGLYSCPTHSIYMLTRIVGHWS